MKRTFTAEGGDYTATSGDIRIQPGPGNRDICTSPISIIDDDIEEPDESFEVLFTWGLIPFSFTVIVTIVDNDQGNQCSAHIHQY